MIRIRSFRSDVPLPNLDVQTGSNRRAAVEATVRALAYGSWDDVSVYFNDGSRALRGEELRAWVERHFPEVLASQAEEKAERAPMTVGRYTVREVAAARLRLLRIERDDGRGSQPQAGVEVDLDRREAVCQPSQTKDPDLLEAYSLALDRAANILREARKGTQ